MGRSVKRGTYDSRDLVGDEIAGLVLVLRCHQEILIEGSREDPQHQIPPRFHARIPCGFAPHL